MTSQDMVDRLRQDYQQLKLKRAGRPRPITANHCYSAGHPCLRYLVLLRVAWQIQRPLSDPLKAALFDEGHHQERALVQDLGEFADVAMQKCPVQIPGLDLVGEVDLFLRYPEDPYYFLADVKSCSPGTYSSIATAADLYEHRLWFVRQWPYQLHLYLRALGGMEWLGKTLHAGASLLLLKEKTTGDIKAIPIPQDQERLDWVFSRLTQVNNYVRKMGLPREDMTPTEETLERRRDDLPPVLRDPRVCGGCAFYVFCSPELFQPVGAAQIIENDDLEHLLEERQKCLVTHEKFIEIDKDVRAILKGFRATLNARDEAHWLVGHFLITAREVTPRGKSPYLIYNFWRAPDPS